jgi:hypothetical protein
MSSVGLISSGFFHRSSYVFHVSLVRTARPTQLSLLYLSNVVLVRGTNFTNLPLFSLPGRSRRLREIAL